MNSTLPILVVEDDAVNVMKIRRAFGDLKVDNEIVIKGDGEEALNYLLDPSALKPCVVLLDLHMPKMGGLELLARMKSDPVLRRIPVIVLTTSQREQDRLDSFDLSVAGYLDKPRDYRCFLEVMRGFNHYWTISQLPA